MRLDKLTAKMQEALAAAQETAANLGIAELDPESVLLALLDQPEGVTRPLLDKLGVAAAPLQAQLKAELARRPRVQGTIQIFIGNELRGLIEAA